MSTHAVRQIWKYIIEKNWGKKEERILQSFLNLGIACPAHLICSSMCLPGVTANHFPDGLHTIAKEGAMYFPNLQL